jgi:hypothetical protein
MRRSSGCLTGCLTKLVVLGLGAVVFTWAVMAALHPWALHIGGRSTPLLYWQGAGTIVSKDGRTYPLYVMFWPGRPQGFHGGGRRDGKTVSGHLDGSGWLCTAPGNSQRMNLSGTIYGPYATTDGSLMDFRLLEWRKAFAINYQHRGFFDLAGQFHGPDLVMDRPGEQGIRLQSGPFIDNATTTLHWASREEFDAACRDYRGQ